VGRYSVQWGGTVYSLKKFGSFGFGRNMMLPLYSTRLERGGGGVRDISDDCIQRSQN
jgi:hypothetical protein